MYNWASHFLKGYPSLPQTPEEAFSNWKDFKENPNTYVSVIKPFGLGQNGRLTALRQETGLINIDENIPYVLLENFKFEGSQLPIKPQFIRLDASPMNLERNSEMIGLMKEFTSLASKFNEALVRSGIISDKYTVTPIGEFYDYERGYYMTGAFITRLADLHRIESGITREGKKKYMLWQHEGVEYLTFFGTDKRNAPYPYYYSQVPPIPMELIRSTLVDGKSLLQVCHELDQMVHGEWNGETGQYERDIIGKEGQTERAKLGPNRSYGSKLQRLLADFAASNFSALLPTGEFKVLRDYEGIQKGEELLVFPSLIGPIDTEYSFKTDSKTADGKAIYGVGIKTHLRPAHVVSKLIKWLGYEIEPGVSRADKYNFTVPEEGKKYLADTLTVEDLVTIFTPDENGEFRHLNNGFGLREPLNDRLFWGKSIPPMDGRVQTRFSGIRPSKMTFDVKDETRFPDNPSGLEIKPRTTRKVKIDTNFDVVGPSAENFEETLLKSANTDLGGKTKAATLVKRFNAVFNSRAKAKVYKLKDIVSTMIKDNVIKKEC